jgi:hypothetical protein
MNKLILTLGGIIILMAIGIVFIYTSSLINKDPISTNISSPLYTLKYSKVIYPNDQLTPGDIQTNDLNVICYEYYSKLLVMLPDDVTKQVYARYNITNPGYHEFEIDHWVPLALGGSNNIENLWPQPVTSPGYKEKDYVHLYLRDQVCNHGMNLEDARKAIIGDWYSLYQNIRGDAKD